MHTYPDAHITNEITFHKWKKSMRERANNRQSDNHRDRWRRSWWSVPFNGIHAGRINQWRDHLRAAIPPICTLCKLHTAARKQTDKQWVGRAEVLNFGAIQSKVIKQNCCWKVCLIGVKLINEQSPHVPTLIHHHQQQKQIPTKVDILKHSTDSTKQNNCINRAFLHFDVMGKWRSTGNGLSVLVNYKWYLFNSWAVSALMFCYFAWWKTDTENGCSFRKINQKCPFVASLLSLMPTAFIFLLLMIRIFAYIAWLMCFTY